MFDEHLDAFENDIAECEVQLFNIIFAYIMEIILYVCCHHCWEKKQEFLYRTTHDLITYVVSTLNLIERI